jgi:hypothetical protein
MRFGLHRCTLPPPPLDLCSELPVPVKALSSAAARDEYVRKAAEEERLRADELRVRRSRSEARSITSLVLCVLCLKGLGTLTCIVHPNSHFFRWYLRDAEVCGSIEHLTHRNKQVQRHWFV